MKQSLGQIRYCRIKDIWDNENDFSDWLSEQENLDLLSDALELNGLQNPVREDSVGSFRADITCEEMDTERTAIIENKFGGSDHDHLGKIITYAAGKDASLIIWIVENARPEHASAIEWLNNNVTNRGFFLVEIKIVRIGDSAPAPVFSIIQKPNEYSQALKSADNGKEFKYQYWEGFLDYLRKDKEFVKEYPGTESRKSTSNRWYTFQKGCRGDFHVECVIFSKNGQLKSVLSQIWISDDNDLFRRFEEHKDEIHKDLEFEMEWDPKEGKMASSVYIKRDVSPGESYESTYKWFRDNTIALKNVFNRYC